MVRSVSKTQDQTDIFGEISLFLGNLLFEALMFFCRLMWWMVRFPWFGLPAYCVGFLLLVAPWWHAVMAAAIFGAFFALWAWVFPNVWDLFVRQPIRWRWRRWIRYTHRWAKICALHGLVAQLDDNVLVPRLLRVLIGSNVDALEVAILNGQTLDDWHKQSDALANAFKARAVRVVQLRPGVVGVEVFRTDPLLKPIPLPHPAVKPDLSALEIGRTESSLPWKVPVLHRHMLVAGATGSGKGSVIWSVLNAVGPAIREGVVSVRVVDPKGGMELGPGEPLFDEFAYDAGESMLQLLRNAVAIMHERANRLRGVARLHIPTKDEPLILVIVDELATHTAYGTDRKVKVEAEQLLGQLLSQGRAVGVSVIGALQDPSKEVLALRQLFPTRIALRMSEQTQMAMVLGQGARDRGARCDEIPDSLPGVGYVAEDGTAEPKRVRAFHVTDNDVKQLATRYRPAPPAYTHSRDDGYGL